MTCRLVITVAIVLGAGPLAFGQNLRPLPLAADCAGLGDACVVGGPHSGSGYSNPAAFGALAGQLLTVSTTLFSRYSLRLEAATPLPDGYEALNDSRRAASSQFAPTAAVYAGAWGEDTRLALAINIAAPVNEALEINDRLESYDAAGTSLYAYDGQRRLALTRLYLGPSLAIGLNDAGLRVGLSVLAVMSQVDEDHNYNRTIATSGALRQIDWLEERSRLRAFGLSAVLGLQLDASESLALGLAAKSPALALHSAGNAKTLIRMSSAASSGGLILEQDMDATGLIEPLELRGGLAWRPTADVELRLEVQGLIFLEPPLLDERRTAASYYSNGQPPDYLATTTDHYLSVRPVVNASLGARARRATGARRAPGAQPRADDRPLELGSGARDRARQRR